MHIPQALLERVTQVVHRIDSILPISGGITNQNYKLETAFGTLMLRLAGEKTELLGIDRQAEYICTSLAHQVGIGAKPYCFLEPSAMLTHFIHDAETLDAPRGKAHLPKIVAAIKKIHAAPPMPKQFSPFETVREYHTIGLKLGVQFPPDTARILERLAHLETALGDFLAVPCHNDLLPANLLLTEQQLFIVDWEYAGNGNPMFDLANLTANLELERADQILELYFGGVTKHHQRQLEQMRVVSDAREAFWGFLQSGISSLEFDFVGYGEMHLERVRVGLR
jgi:thiamine kinase-like enzyme